MRPIQEDIDWLFKVAKFALVLLGVNAIVVLCLIGITALWRLV